jgi:hypothetical protein
MPGNKILCVAEKPSIAKAVAAHLAGGHPQVVSHRDTVSPCANVELILLQAKPAKLEVQQEL